MAKKINNKVDKIIVRMYRVGTGDFFILKFETNGKTTFKLMIDCGCINGSHDDFEPKVLDLKTYVDDEIDLLVVTHEHADHINGFASVSEIFDTINIKQVWFSWTESKDDAFANDLRQNHADLQNAVAMATEKLNSISFESMFEDEFNAPLMLEAKTHFVNTLNEINDLSPKTNFSIGVPKPTMEDILKSNKVIKPSTKVLFLDPGRLIENLEGAAGIRFFILGPPRDNKAIGLKEKAGEGFEKRQKPSTNSFAFMSVFNMDNSENSLNEIMPFEDNYIVPDDKSNELTKSYKAKTNNWRNINSDWLFSAGSLALRHEKSINNTSLVMAIQFIDSEKVLLFPGDAEHGNWLSWQNETLEWTIKDNTNKDIKVKADYILKNTVFYKVGHHLSQNGTAKGKGLDKMLHQDLAAMVTLDFKKINNRWLNTMPNDLIGAELIRKTNGKLFFVGDRDKILKNIKTDRVIISDDNVKKLNDLNAPFDGKFFIDYEVKA